MQLMIDPLLVLLPQARSGQVKGLAITTAKRSALAPDIPTAAESGMNGLEFASWYGIWASKGVPAEVEDEWNRWYSTIYVPNYEKVPGVIRGRRYRAVEGTPRYLTFYEFEDPKVSESDAWAVQRDASPANARMRDYMQHAPGSPGVYVKTFAL